LCHQHLTLWELANELGVGKTYTIDFTKELPTQKGFRAVEFDSLKDEFSPLGEDLRGYKIEIQESEISYDLNEPEELPSYDGVVIYNVNPAQNCSKSV